MKKLKKLLPILVLALVLVFALMPSEDGSDIQISPQSVENQTNAVFQVISDLSESAAPEETPAPTEKAVEEPAPENETAAVQEDGYYTSRDDVALYIHTYGHLPGNFVTKKEAQKTGWQGGGLDDYLPGMSIGGDRFGNYEGLLPDAKGRVWKECDIDTMNASSRGAKRIVFSNDGLIYYTDDHYESFTQLY